jgi:hypothetical protein
MGVWDKGKKGKGSRNRSFPDDDGYYCEMRKKSPIKSFARPLLYPPRIWNSSRRWTNAGGPPQDARRCEFDTWDRARELNGRCRMSVYGAGYVGSFFFLGVAMARGEV